MFATAQLENLEITSFRFRRAIFQQQQKNKNRANNKV